MTAHGADFLQLDIAQAPARDVSGWLAEQLYTAVLDGRLAAGTRLPATRSLAAELGVSRGAVVEAYTRLRERGLISSRSGSGTVVAARAAAPTRGQQRDPRGLDRLPHPVRTNSAVIDLTPGLPDVTAFPRAAWLRHERAALDRATIADLGYGDPRGHQALRDELAGWLARVRGVRTEPNDIVVVGGVAQSLALLAQVLDSPVAVEDPGSRGAREQLGDWHMPWVPVPVDDAGLRVDVLRGTEVGAAVLTPAHQYPTGVVLSAERRRELLGWARDGHLVIEDDYDAEHRYDRTPVPALQPHAPDHVAHTGSVSKTLAPGLRLGWLVPPHAMLTDLVAAKHASDLGTSVLPQLVLAGLIASGDLDRHLRSARARQRRRRDALVSAVQTHLPQARIVGVAAGLHLLLTFPTLEFDDLALTEMLATAGVVVHPLSWHRVTPGDGGLILGYAAHSPDQLERAVRRIAVAIRDQG